MYFFLKPWWQILTFLTFKNVHNQNQQHPLEWFNTCAFKNINICGPSYEIY
jgi:hypothetical protein